MDSITKIINKLRSIASIGLIPKHASLDFCALSFDSDTLSLASIRHRGDKPELRVCINVPCGADNFQNALTDLVQKYHLEGVPCSWVLSPKHYQLMLLEELPVAASEFQAAIRWKVRELISFPVDQAVIDTFNIPLSKIPNSKPTMMVAIAQRKMLEEMTLQIYHSGLELTCIDIPELAYRNITSLYEKDDASTAFVYLQEKNTTLIISRQKILYLTRRLDWGLDAHLEKLTSNEDIQNNVDLLTLELQRSFDYYQSQWRTLAPTRILLASSIPLSHDITHFLSQRLGVTVLPLNLNEVLLSKHRLDLVIQNQQLSTIGGALRQEMTDESAD